MRYAINLAPDGRVLSATFEQYAEADMPIIDSLPDGNITDYKYINNGFVYEPVVLAPEAVLPTEIEKLEAQVTYTAMMTDTLIEEA